MNSLRRGVSGLIIKEQSLLLIKREKAPYKNRWTLPGGKIENEESIDNAIKREIQEEVGLIVDVYQPLIIQVIKKYNYVLYTKCCSIIGEEIPQEKIEFQYFPIQDFFLMEKRKLTPDLQIITKILLDSL
ncbi:unnamed protein product (macronuclear) [Paramecium tetraurelia]|uniref:Nudix hydrolase domain-containing protein n=1 Tax=Paramecium tetraurelia TaxID=5888 RepID=A0E319_PARTE|nr:uncharacterized protein GSPATT00022859001 [Paramecium tetraurelia]CAK89686.1 unnamed protein product [Paramecium tetraurelia]|eukprot:XP_001457083.1 hypothetical protein (macronuclear) [Paramecium tetraurelia strain d4-2]